MDRDAFWDAIYSLDEKTMAACLAGGQTDGADLEEVARATLQWLRADALWMKVGMTLSVLVKADIRLTADARHIGLWALEKTLEEADKGDAEVWWNSTREIYDNLPLEGITDGEQEVLRGALVKAEEQNEWEHVFRLLRIAHRAGVDVTELGRVAFARAQDPENQFKSDFGWDYLPDIVAALADTGVLTESEASALTHVGPLLHAADHGADLDYAPLMEEALAWARQPDHERSHRWPWEYLSRLLVLLGDEGAYDFNLGKSAPKVIAALVGAERELTPEAAAVVRKHASQETSHTN